MKNRNPGQLYLAQKIGDAPEKYSEAELRRAHDLIGQARRRSAHSERAVERANRRMRAIEVELRKVEG